MTKIVVSELKSGKYKVVVKMYGQEREGVKDTLTDALRAADVTVKSIHERALAGEL